MTNIETLKDLTQTTYDSVEGYRIASEKAESPAIKQAFARRHSARSETHTKLNDALQALGEKPVLSTSIKGEAHQLLTIADTFVDGQDATIKRVEQGEQYLAKKFSDALDGDDLERQTRMVVETAYRDIREGERFAQMLEDEYA